MRRFHDMGFEVSLARQWEAAENTAAIEERFRAHLRRHGLPENLRIVSFPDFYPPGSAVETPQITTHCMTHFQSAESRANFMCAFSRMVVKRNGSLGVYPCTLVDDDPDYELSGTLRDSLDQRIMLRHHRCYSCFAHGSSCSEING